MRKIGFIGLGMMGLPMVDNLAKVSDFHIGVFDQKKERVAELHMHPNWGGTLFSASALDDFSDRDIVITMLPNSVITNQVVEQLCDVMSPGALVIDMGSSNPEQTQKLCELLAYQGIDMVDAPVSGAVAKARSGTLAIMAGGSVSAVERAIPVLEKMGTALIRTGNIGSAHAMKALNNYVYAAGLLAAAEALLIADRLGLDKEVFTNVLNASSGKNVATETKLRQFIIPKTFSGGFAMHLQAKDLSTADALRTQTGVNAPQLAQCTELWAKAVLSLDASADNTRIYEFLDSLTA